MLKTFWDSHKAKIIAFVIGFATSHFGGNWEWLGNLFPTQPAAVAPAGK